MFSAAFHARRRNTPNSFRRVDFAPTRTYDLPRATGRQHAKFEGSGAKAVMRPELGHERWRLLVWEGGVMLHPSNLGPCRQYLVQVTPPARGVFALAEFADGRPIEDGLDAST